MIYILTGSIFSLNPGTGQLPREARPGEMADNLEAKIAILIKYHAVLPCDRIILDGLIAAVRDVYNIDKGAGFLMEYNGKIYWDKLIQPLRYFKHHDYR